MAQPSAARSDVSPLEDGLLRSVSAEQPRAWFRLPICFVVSLFLYVYVGTVEWAAWLAIILSLEALGFWVRARVIAGEQRFASVHVFVTFLVSLTWVSHALALWRVGGDIPHIAALMDVFSVALYGAIGAHQNKRLMLVLLGPPLLALSGMLISFLWINASPFTATFASLATLGSCATILMNGLAMHRADRDLFEANRALTEFAEAARAANAAKDGFLANMSHEIRTPLNGVVGVAAALSQTRLSAQQREMVELIHSSAGTLEHLLSDLLDLSKIESGKIELTNEPFDLRFSIETAAYLLSVRADDKGVGFRVHFSASARGYFNGDAIRIRQIVSNLVSNAVKFTERGDVTLQVDVADPPSEDAPSTVRIEVRDTGVGFDAEVAKRLFQRFEQADSSITRRFGGSGLGLSICKTLAKLMGGDVTGSSVPGQGSVFVATLPLRRAEPTSLPEEAQRATPDRSSAQRPDGTLMRVLLAEDNPVNQRVFSLILEQLGANLTIAEDGVQAIQEFRAASFDLVMMDMQMPVMDGLAATRGIREIERDRNGPRTPIAMVSANAMPAHIKQAIDAGCDFHLSKPVTPSDLSAALQQALELRAATLRKQEAVSASTG